MAQKFLSDIHPTAGLKDSSGDLGSDGQVLSSTGSNTNWVNPTVGTTVIYKDAFTATNNQTAFTLANTVDSEDKTQVYIDGAYQSKGGYSVSGTTLTFDTGLVTSSAVEVMTFSTATANNAASAVKIDTFTGDGSDLTFVLDEAVVDEKVTQVYINGVYQNKSTYSIAADLVTLTFGSGNAPPNSTAIEVISFKTITSTDGTLTATTFLGDLNGTINTATTATTQSAGNNTTKIATTAFVTTASNAKVADAINNGTTGIAPSQNAVFDALALKSNIAGPTFTGTPAAPTASAGTNTTQLATTAFVTTGIANIVDSSPGALNTLNELAAALGDDANFSTTVTNSIATKLPLAGGTLTGDVTFTGASYNAVWDTSANLLQFADNAVIRIGTGNDVDIYHSSNVTYIKTQTDQPVSFIDAGGADILKLTPNGAVDLYHNGTLALSTGSGGNATFAGKVGMNVAPASTRTLLVKGQGTSSSTAPFQVNDGNNADILVIKDDKTATFSGNVKLLGILELNDVAQSINFIQSGAINFDSNNDQTGRVLTIGSNRTGVSGGTTNVTFSEDGNSTFGGSVTVGGNLIVNNILDVKTGLIRLYNSNTFLGGLMKYSSLTGTGSDHSPTLFSQGNLYLATGGGATQKLTITSGGSVHFKFAGSTQGDYNIIGSVAPHNTGNRYAHVRISTGSGDMYYLEVFGFNYGNALTQGRAGGYVYGSGHSIYNSQLTGSIVAQYKNQSYVEIVVDMISTDTSNRWGSFVVTGGTDNITSYQPLYIMAYSFTSNTNRVY